ncbi:hypothetical protein E2C01_094959 [Portunus trituberculatus]|uniref:Uncharacterized protein n=1 Tax=Portunus trituberculatus TaxID=210409 RepID=A0A5B7JXJ2_PORTR|nr:hypothetical protein [Portunus trituberculatus]
MASDIRRGAGTQEEEEEKEEEKEKQEEEEGEEEAGLLSLQEGSQGMKNDSRP